jgi:hypothetical protein
LKNGAGRADGVDTIYYGARTAGVVAGPAPACPTSPNAYDPADTALDFIGGILCGVDNLAWVAHLAHDPAVAERLGIEAIPSQSTLAEVSLVAHFWLRPAQRLGFTASEPGTPVTRPAITSRPALLMV